MQLEMFQIQRTSRYSTVQHHSRGRCQKPPCHLFRVTDSAYTNDFSPHVPGWQVCGGDTGHAEVVQLTYDPSAISIHDILRVFFTLHDPTTKDRQGNDVGTQYRSIILYHSEEQRQAAEEVMAEVAAEQW